MSALFRIRIELTAGPTVWARFDVCHPDQGNVPATKAIALLVVLEVYREMSAGIGFHRDNNRPISQSKAAELASQHPARELLEEWLAYYSRFDGAAILSAADEAITLVELTNQHGNPRQAEGDPHPIATLVFTVSDAILVTHLTGGYRFESAMCDCSYW